MRVELAKLRSSHVRDFRIDPLEEEDAKSLIVSIQEDGFWGGVVLTKGNNGHHEIVAGHKRIYAAIQAGETHADLHVAPNDEQKLIRIYARENLSQRGAHGAGLATAGAIASAARYLIKGILKDDKEVTAKFGSDFDLEKIRRNLGNDKGIGRELILAFYRGVDGIKQSIVEHHLANLKASGDYARIVKEVTKEIEKEHVEEIAELERKEKEALEKQQAEQAAKARLKKEKSKANHAKAAETGKKATEAASKNPVTFDLAGVGKFLKTEHHLRVFRKCVERSAVQEHLPIEKQAALAESMVKNAEEKKQDVDGQFIEQYIASLIGDVVADERRVNKEAMAERERHDALIKWVNLSHHFCLNIVGVAKDGRAMIRMKDEYPDFPFTITQELRRAVTYAQPVINELAAKLDI